jgi:hypothetical protein
VLISLVYLVLHRVLQIVVLRCRSRDFKQLETWCSAMRSASYGGKPSSPNRLWSWARVRVIWYMPRITFRSSRVLKK